MSSRIPYFCPDCFDEDDWSNTDNMGKGMPGNSNMEFEVHPKSGRSQNLYDDDKEFTKSSTWSYKDSRRMGREMKRRQKRMDDSSSFGGFCPCQEFDTDDDVPLSSLKMVVDTSQSTDKMFIALVKMVGFSSNDVKVKVKNCNLIVSANHEDSFDDNIGKKEYRYKHICHQFNLPASVKEEDVKHSLENDKTLRIEVHLPESKDNKPFDRDNFIGKNKNEEKSKNKETYW
ncbi:uncharacterized protein LOC134607748 [Pelobates fuscus]|uniref:uncharacterized protein LOC134607748 n=1 Tax=Pelobates fuscus TaxID=191477 RepID=UPI002FE46CA9